jgi:hypothetical protein
MASSTLSVPRSRTIAIAGVTAVVLAFTAHPLVSALANPRAQNFSTPSHTQEGIAVLDPVTGLLIHPITGVLIDLTRVVYDVALEQYVDPITGAIIPADGSIPGLPPLPVPNGPTASPEFLNDVARVVESILRSPANDGSAAAPSRSETSEELSDQEQSLTPDNGSGEPASPGSSQSPLVPGVDDAGPTVLMSSPAKTIVSVVDLVLDDSNLSADDDPQTR